MSLEYLSKLGNSFAHKQESPVFVANLYFGRTITLYVLMDVI